MCYSQDLIYVPKKVGNNFDFGDKRYTQRMQKQ